MDRRIGGKTSISILECYTTLYPSHNTSKYMRVLGGAHNVMAIVVGNGHGDQRSNLDKAVCLSLSGNTFGKCMNRIILPPSMGK